MEPLFQVGGLASGLDTQSIIDQLITIERTPIRRLESRKGELDKVDHAWSTIAAKMSGLRSALDAIRHQSDWGAFATASSSNDTVAVATVSGGAVDQTAVSFTVESLASRHRVATSGTFASASDLVGTGTLTLTDSGGSTLATITTDATTTLADLAAQIDAADVGVDAQVLSADGTTSQLVLTARDTGSAKQFAVATDLASLGTVSTIATGTDAHLKMGSLDIYRSSNTITDLVQGVTIDLKSTSATEVTVSAGRDVDAAVEAVQSLVDAVNDVLNTASDLSRYNPDSDTAAPLQGDSTLRSLALNLRSAISGTIDSLGGSFGYAGAVGISLTRDGTISLDQSKLRTALEQDFEGVTAVFAQNLSTTDSRVSFSFSSDATAAGSYNVVATQAARVAAVTGTSYTPPSGSPKVFSITADDGTVVSVTIDAGMTVDQAISAINSQLASAGVSTVSASNDGGQIALAETRYGSAYSFTVSGYGADLDGTWTGQDVAGTIDGVAATGTGQTLQATTGAAAGLGLKVTATQDQVTSAGGSLGLGVITYSNGIGGALDRVLAAAEGYDGSIQRARDLISGQKRLYDDQIAEFEVRIELRADALRRKFANLESTMGQLQSQGQWLAGQLSGLMG